MSLLQEHKHQGAYLCVTSASGVCEASLHLGVPVNCPIPCLQMHSLALFKTPQMFPLKPRLFSNVRTFLLKVYFMILVSNQLGRYLRENLLETALCCQLSFDPQLQIPSVYLQLWCLTGLIVVQVHCASCALNQQLNNWHLNRTYSGDVTEVLLIIQIKLVHFSCQTMYSGDFSKN